MKKCPYCAEEIQDEAIKCKHCGEMLNKPPAAPTYTPATDEVFGAPPKVASERKMLGYLLLGIGVLGLIAALGMNVSVDVPVSYIGGQAIGGGRVNNIGLMQDRQNYLMLSGLAMVLGVLLAIFGGDKTVTRESVRASGRSAPQTMTMSRGLMTRRDYAAAGFLAGLIAGALVGLVVVQEAGPTVYIAVVLALLGSTMGWYAYKDPEANT